jgi:hypothetical protein
MPFNAQCTATKIVVIIVNAQHPLRKNDAGLALTLEFVDKVKDSSLMHCHFKLQRIAPRGMSISGDLATEKQCIFDRTMGTS